MQACNCNKAVLSLANSQQTDAANVATRKALQRATCRMEITVQEPASTRFHTLMLIVLRPWT